MIPYRYSPSKSLFNCLIFGFLLALFYFLTTWYIGINLADEGYYWYGTQRILHGEIPILDFMAYDPGRYYLSAIAMAIVGSDGIWAARLAAYLVLALLVSLGIYLALLSFHGNRIAQLFYSLVVSLILFVWTYPYFRAFDFLAGVLLILGISIFFRQRTPFGWFFAGLILGVVAVLGRNHGVYGVFGYLIALAIIHLDRASGKPIASSYYFWLAGVTAGYLPVIFLSVFVSGFSQAFFESIKFIIDSGTTNIKLPVPWPWAIPWTLDFSKSGVWNWSIVIYFTRGLLFVALLVFPIAGLGYLARAQYFGRPLFTDRPGHSVFLAAVCLGLPYAHYALSRADIEHLAPSMLPMIFGILSMPVLHGAKPRLSVGLLLLISGFIVMVGHQPALRYILSHKKWETYTIGPDKIQIPSNQAASLRVLDNLVQAELSKGGSFLALPDLPGLHAIHHSKIPVWEIYSLLKREKPFEEKEIQRLEKIKPSLVILSNHALDKNESFRYSSLHPLIYQWLNTQYRKEYLWKDMEIYRLKY